MKLYKLTDKDGRTYGKTQWGPGVSHRALPGTRCKDCDGGLCTHHYVHAYTDPLLAVLLDPIHAQIGEDARLWEARGRVAARDHGLKVGCKELTTLREIPLPKVTTAQRIRFGILCALEVSTRPTWRAWAEGWLDGSDRSKASARDAWAGAATAAEDAWAGAVWAVEAALAAAEAAALDGDINLPALARRAVEEES